MLHILLLILKIIGIILLCILGILILGIVCVLFVPVRYRIEAVRQEGEVSPPVELRVKITWLLHLINFLLNFDGTLFLRVRFLGITIFKRPKKEAPVKAAKEKPKKARKRSRAAETENEAWSKENGEKKQKTEENIPDTQTSKGTAADREETSTDKEAAQKTAETDKTASDKRSFFDRLRAVPEIFCKILTKIRNLFQNIQYTIQKFCDKISAGLEKAAYYREILEGEPFKRSFALCKDELSAIGKSLQPDKWEAQMIIGLDDPAATGEVLAVCGMLYPLFAGHVNVAGDFEKKRLEGCVLIKGKIRMFTFLHAVVRIYFNKDIKKLIKLLKKEAV